MFERQYAHEPDSIKTRKFNEALSKVVERIEELEKEIARLKLTGESSTPAKKAKSVKTESEDKEAE